MMTGISFFIKKLRNILSEDTQSWVLSALRQDPLVWKCLQDSELSDHAIEILGSAPDRWTPANLSLIALGYAGPLSEVLKDPRLLEMTDLPLDPQIVGKQHVNETNKLAQAGLFAIKQVKHAQESGSWNDLPMHLLSKSGEFSRSALACFYGFAPDPLSPLQSILETTANINEICNFVIHAVLSNPLPIHEQEKVLSDLLKDLSLQNSNLFLRNLYLQRPDFATSLAKQFIPSQNTPKDVRPNAHIIEQVNFLSEVLLHSEINEIANLHSETITFQSQALQSVNQLRLEIAAQLAGAEVAKGDIETALSTWQRGGERRSSPKQSRTLAPLPELLIALIESGNPADAMALIPETEMQDIENCHPSHLIAAARLAIDEGNSILAKSFAKKAFQKFEIWPPESTTEIPEKAHSPRTFTQTNSAMVKLLSDLSLHLEVVKATRVALSFRPNDIELLDQHAQALIATGDPSSATEAAYVTVSLSPDNKNLRRQLITCLEESGDWDAVVLERVALLDNRFSPGPEITWPNKKDQIALAKAYLFAEQPERTIEICNSLLQEDEQDGITHAMLGEAYIALGKTEEALSHLDQATQYSPHEAAPWMALARTQEKTNHPEKALEILRSASYAVPLDPSIKLALAEKYLEDGEISQALPVLKEAHQLLIDNQLEIDTHSAKNSSTDKRASSVTNQIAPKVSLILGETLLELGYQTEALQVLENAYTKYPAYQGLAYSYAQTLLSLGDYSNAIPPLVIAVQAEEDELGPNLDYGRALLEVKTQPNEAVRALTKAANIAPSDPIIRALLAEALLANGQAEDAMDTYSQVLESPLMDEMEWMSRILHGFGRTALALEKPDIATASLQEAAQADPQNPEIFRTLTEAFTAADLTKEALKVAHTAKQLAPDDVEMLIWYANILTKLQKTTDAIPALTRALELSPNQPALLIQLGNVQSLAGEEKAAVHTYRKILMTENPDAYDLLDAAEGLNQLGDFINAIACLELGLEILSEPEPEFLKQLALSYKSINQFDRALETLDRACALEPESIDLLTEKTDLLVLLERPQAAEASLEHALNVHPENKILHEKMALFYRKTGNITKALSKAEELVAMHLDEPQSSDALAARALAAELARALLQHDYAISILENQSTIETIQEGASTDGEKTDPDVKHISPIAAPYFCLLAEIALEHDEEVSSANHLTKAFELAPNHPRVLALQSRLSKRSNDYKLANQTFTSALEAVDQSEKHTNKSDIEDGHDISPSYSDTEKFHQEICNLMAVAEAAGEIKQWEKRFDILEKVSTLIPMEPFVYVQLARTLTLRAEYQDFCQMLGAINNTPGDIALTADTYQTFKENLETAENHFKSANKKRQLDETMFIKRWKIRGEAIFQPNTLNHQPLEEITQDTDDFAALITSITKTKNITGIHNIYNTLKEYSDFKSHHHLPLARVAHSLSNGCRRQEDQEEAMTLIQAAIQQDSSEPLYHALLAEIAYKQGDNEVAIQSIDTALASWPNEPRWHATAAIINISEGDISAAITHLKIAAELEPDHLPHQLALGECLQKNGEYRAAIQTLESVRDIAPNNIEPLLGLARAYLSIGEYGQAASYAQSATNKAPNEITPLLVCAEVALQAGNPREAQKYVNTALHINSQDTEALKMNSHVLQALGRFEEALETLEQAIQLAEKPLKLMLERADLVASTQGSKAALKNLQDLALEYPEEPDVLYHLARALATGGQNKAAILVAQKALRCDTFSLTTKELSQIHYLLGQLMRQAGQLDQAIYQLNESVRLTPVYLEPYLELGRAHQERRQHALSLQTYQKAITMAPDDPRPYCQAGLLLKESYDYQGAESMLRRAADLAPDDLSIHRQLGALIALNIVHNRRAIPKA